MSVTSNLRYSLLSLNLGSMRLMSANALCNYFNLLKYYVGFGKDLSDCANDADYSIAVGFMSQLEFFFRYCKISRDVSIYVKVRFP